MKKMIRLKSIILILISLILITGSVFAQEYENGMLKGVVRVKFKPALTAKLNTMTATYSNGIVKTGLSAVDNVNTELSAVKMKRVFPYSVKHEAKHIKHGLHLWYEIDYNTSVSAKEAAASYSLLQDVDIAEPIYAKTLITGEVKYAEASSTKEGLPMDDPYLDKQWHYNNDGGINGSIKGADINLYKAWEIQKGSSNVIVSIVDGGIDTKHEDLKGNLWVNEAELEGEEGVDDDGNGFIDDVHGYNFVKNKGAISAHFHGTHVAGTVSAVNNNNVGVSGVAGGSGNNDGARLMSCQVFTEDGGTGDYASAIIYGADNGAVISQNSWGYMSPGVNNQSINDAIDYFIAEAGLYANSPMKGGIVFFASGNSNADGEWYPAFYENAIAVSAYGPAFKKAGYSNYGTWVDVSAPGGDASYGTEGKVLSTLPGNKYGHLQGTSMACPHVSGIAALVVSEFGGVNFTNEDLKNRILTATKDIDQYNENYVGKLGKGYIDTYLALKSDEKIAPNAIADLNLTGIAQDFANLKWTVPADTDDVEPVGFEIAYSETAITDENFSDATVSTLENNNIAGTETTIEILNLEGLTQYYFAVRSIDRWGNISKVSNVVSGTTNAGPDINVAEASIDLTINTTETTVGTAQFNLLNEDEGILKWESFIRHKKPALSYNTVSYPEAKAGVSTFDARVAAEEVHEEKLISNEATTSAFQEQLMYHFDPYGRVWVIGDEDTEVTNSSAIKFVVDKAEGFNFTHIDMHLKHDKANGPFIMEVYVGEKMDKENLVAVQEGTSYKVTPYRHTVKLDEEIFLENGQTFWIVCHAPAGNLYPLGMAQEGEEQNSDYSFYSADMGKTWLPLADVIEHPGWVWSTTAVSENEFLGHFVSLDPTQGSLEGNSAQEISLTADVSTLINGDYTANILYKSNDKDEKEYRVPLNIKVEGQPAILVNDKSIDFGSVFYGLNKELSFTIKNTGYGNFKVASCVSTNSQFEIITRPWSIAARNQQDTKILYTPDGSGNDNGEIVFTDYKGNVHSVRLFGVGALPSEIAVAPKSVDLGDKAIGDVDTTTFTITNNGEYPLEYAIPAFAENIDGLENVHSYGYSIETNLNDTTVVYQWNDIASSGIDITEMFKNPLLKDHTVDLGFEFPFYETTIEKANLTRYGIITFDDGHFGYETPPTMRNTPGCIAATALFLNLNQGGSIHYKREQGKFIVQYTNVRRQTSWGMGKEITFQIVLYYNGDVDILYNDIATMSSYLKKNLLIGIQDIEKKDPCLFNDRTIRTAVTNQTIVSFKSPGKKLISSVSAPSGVIKVGESKEIEVAVKVEDVYAGNLFQRLSILSNDPFNKTKSFEIKLNVTGGEADVVISTDSINFGEVFQNGAMFTDLSLKNEGTKDVNITSITLANNSFNLVGAEVPVLLKAKSSYFIKVELPTGTVAQLEDVLTITLDDASVFEINITGDVVGAPTISADIASIEDTIDAKTKITKKVTITNSGANDLEVVASGNDWLYVEQPDAATSSLKQFSYSHMLSTEDNGPVYNWEHIKEDGTRIPFEFFSYESTWFELALPFEIPFYNEMQDTVYIAWNGVLTFDKPRVTDFLLWKRHLPYKDKINNVIAPYWNVSNWMSKLPNSEVGVFYKMFDDRIVVSYQQYVDLWFMGRPYNFQVIIYKNGNIKFQYDTEGRSSLISSGLIPRCLQRKSF
jgi:subtilisin family serine protease